MPFNEALILVVQQSPLPRGKGVQATDATVQPFLLICIHLFIPSLSVAKLP